MLNWGRVHEEKKLSVLELDFAHSEPVLRIVSGDGCFKSFRRTDQLLTT
jgi:hypothetical protein